MGGVSPVIFTLSSGPAGRSHGIRPAFPRFRFGAHLGTAPGCHRPAARYRRLPSLLSRRFPNLPAVEPGGAQDLQIIRRFGDWRFGGSVKLRPRLRALGFPP